MTIAIKGLESIDQFSRVKRIIHQSALTIHGLKNGITHKSTLFYQIWTPELMNIIGDGKNVYFAPDGFLHQLAIEYMMPDTLKDCCRLSSTRVFL